MTKQEKNTLELLLIIKDVFEKNDIEFWLRNGTLLGAVREHKFIPWDGDIDLGVHLKDFSKKKKESLSIDLEKKGCSIVFLPYNHTFIIRKSNTIPANVRMFNLLEPNSSMYTYQAKNKIGKVLVNLYRFFSIEYFGSIYTKNVSFSIRLSKVLSNRLASKFFLKLAYANKAIVRSYYNDDNAICFNKFCSINFYDNTFKVPKEYYKYLEITYGEEWEQPNKNFKYEEIIEEI